MDRTKHQDELDAPKRLHRLEALKRSVSGVESAVRIYSGLGSRIVRGNDVAEARAAVMEGKAAVEAYGDTEARMDYGRVMDLLNAAESSPPEILEALQESASSIHKSITIL